MADAEGFERLRDRRVRYVESARENDFEDGLRSLLSELYPDNAHFIYELLQNAEDARATTVDFVLADDHLTVTHDGQRAFSLQDIDSITGIGKSTKKDDPTQIGKFGVGFKAVFAYTARPEIRSGPYAFAIADLFVPEEVAGAAAPGTTSFRFPFDRVDKPADTASEEVARGLSDLDEKTVLFLNNINVITYALPNGSIGIIERELVDDRVIRITRTVDDDSVESHYLRISGPASVTQGSENSLTVAAAFRLEARESKSAKGSKHTDNFDADARGRFSVVPIDDGDVSIYFPAVKESSGLRFHIHAPFASTVARDSVRDDPGNVHLVMDIATLLVDSLLDLRDAGLIDDNFLAALPNNSDSVGHPFNLIREALVEAFNDFDITPVWGAGAEFAAARGLVTSPPEFRDLLKPADLPVLFELAEMEAPQTPRWIRDRSGRAGDFLKSLAAIEYAWDELSMSFSNAHDYGDPDDAFVAALGAWLDKKTDSALIDLYRLIGRGEANHYLWGRGGLDDVPVVRLRRRGRTEHVQGRSTFLPSSRGDATQARVPVDLAYFEDDEDLARTRDLGAFYSAAGVKRWDEAAKIDKRLAEYTGQDHPIPDDSDLTQHLDDVRAFARFGLSNPQSAKAKFASANIVLAPQSDGSLRWTSPKQIFVDLPFRQTGLAALYPRQPLYWKDGGGFAYDRPPYPLAGIYLDVDGITEFLELLGAQNQVEITAADVKTNPQFDWSWTASHRENYNSVGIDWQIEHLDRLLESGDEDLLRGLWNCVCGAPAAKADARYRANASAPPYRMPSKLAQDLRSNAWILDRSGDLRFPRDMTADELPAGWERPAEGKLAYAVGFGEAARTRRVSEEQLRRLLKEEGLEEDDVQLMRELKEAGVPRSDLQQVLQAHVAMERFPDGASLDPDRRAQIAALDAVNAPAYTTELRARTVVLGQAQARDESKSYLRGHYTTPAGEMHCQTCRKVLPFRTGDGAWYFEAVSFVGGRRQVHKANALALCPLCAALYKHSRQTDDATLAATLAALGIEDGQGSLEIPVVLNSKRTEITFTAKHAIDLRAALRAAGGERA